jgi:beta-lactamase regulating signal transducer with metallopeptidase domain
MAWLLTWLVQGLAIALIARLALRALPGLSAATRYAMWWAALVLVLILPLVRGLTIGAIARGSTSLSASEFGSTSTSTSAPTFTAASAASSASASAVSSAPSGGDISSASARVPDASDATPGTMPGPGMAMPLLQSLSLPPISLPRVPDWLLSIVIGLWLGSAMLGLAQLAYSVHAVRRLKESCRRMLAPRESDLPMWSAVRDRGRAVRVRASDRVLTAAVLGLTRPVIAVPRDAAETLTPHEIDLVVLHEYAHVQRYDDWTKLLQVLIGAFFSWHPAVRLMMREIDFEREASCDDYVVDVTGAPRAYARCLTKVIEMMPGPGLAAVPYASSTAHHATTRIERLLDRRRPSGRLAVIPAMAGSLTLAALAFCTVHALPIATDHPRASSASALPYGASTSSVEARNAAVTVAPGASVAEDVSGLTAPGTRRLDLRIAGASPLPIDLPFSGFSPLSRLTGARLPSSRATPPATPPAAPPATPPTTPPTASPTTPASTDSSARGLAALPTPTPTPTSSSAPAPGAPASTSTSVTPADRPAAAPVAAPMAHVAPAAPKTTGTADMPSVSTPHADTTLALGPVASAADSGAMPEASQDGHIERAWATTRDATSKAVVVSARAVGTATKTAGDATKTATNKAAAGVKVSSVKTARVFGRVTRSIASVF